MSDTIIDGSKEKASAWATLLYPESCETNFLEIIESSGYPCLLSPEHNQDIDENGVLKKPHYHLLIWFKGSRRKSQVEKLRLQLKAVGLEKINNPQNYARYLCHLDDPDKAQYSKESVICFGGLNYASILAKSIDKNLAIIELVNISENCNNFLELVRKVKKDYPEYIGILSSKSYFFNLITKGKGESIYVSNSIRKEENRVYPKGDGFEYDKGNKSPFIH